MLKAYPFARLRVPTLATVKWLSLAVVAVPVLVLSTRRAPGPAAPTGAEPIRSIPLTLTAESGRLSLGWDRESPGIQAAQCGVLWITDGAIRRRVILDANHLRAGKLFYWPVNKDVSFEIKMAEGNDRSETVCDNNATALLEPAERPARREQRAETTASGNRLNKVHRAQRQSIESRRSEDVSGRGNARIASSKAPALTPAFTTEGESQLAEALPVQAIQPFNSRLTTWEITLIPASPSFRQGIAAKFSPP